MYHCAILECYVIQAVVQNFYVYNLFMLWTFLFITIVGPVNPITIQIARILQVCTALLMQQHFLCFRTDRKLSLSILHSNEWEVISLQYLVWKKDFSFQLRMSLCLPSLEKFLAMVQTEKNV